MRFGQYDIQSDGDYYTVKRVTVVIEGKNAGQEKLVDARYFHGSDATLAYFSRSAIAGGLTVAKHVGGLEKACFDTIKAMFVEQLEQEAGE